MLNYDPALTNWLIALVVLGVVAGLLGIVALVDAAVSHRRSRLARYESVRSYYRGLTPTL
ncbi:hypothetical protein [Nocardioides sp.]|jgi:hypothetical protein|uniref:hypothetical protein n=1 Tax=Nocardioides sp. TaxID=35761 RepID=UPI0031FE7729|nr:hypothetical protein [Nocardioides sp.]